MESELKPRLCFMVKGENGYGFHLHGEKGKSGQYIRKVEPDSPAEAAGLRAGDRVVEVNGENVEKETHHQVVQRIKALELETRLLVVDRDTDEYLRSLRLNCTEDMAVGEKTASAASSPATPSKRENGSIPKPPRSSSPAEEEVKPSKRSPSRAGKKEKKARPQPEPESAEQVIEEQEQEPELFPRLCHLIRAETGYGFNLHSEKAKPGQYIRSLDPDSRPTAPGSAHRTGSLRLFIPTPSHAAAQQSASSLAWRNDLFHMKTTLLLAIVQMEASHTRITKFQ
ncbi:hypothetical protein GJAV_G00222220 [Gymnothorax javanicus]|nr:hypothetical protein GJAV_G00222220 [Gymnothorax javanicus]